MQVHQQPSPCSRSRTQPWWCCSWPRCTSRWTGSPAKTHCCQSHQSFASAVASCRSYYLNNHLVTNYLSNHLDSWRSFVYSEELCAISTVTSGWLNHFNHFNLASSSIQFSMNPIPEKFPSGIWGAFGKFNHHIRSHNDQNRLNLKLKEIAWKKGEAVKTLNFSWHATAFPAHQ